MGSPRDLISLMPAKDPAASSQERVTILDVAKNSSTGKLSSAML